MRTTPEAFDLQRTFREMLDAGDVACAMEISSHALELKRADGIHVAAAVFTNLTQDHLDFHPTMEDYFQAKRLLFASPLTSVRIANADDAYGRRLIEEFDGRDVRDRRARPTTARSTSARTRRAATSSAVTPDGAFPARVPLPGASTCSTRWRAWAAARALGAPADGLAASLAARRDGSGPLPAGRGGQPFGVVVDYAHKPDALEQVLLAARELAGAADRASSARAGTVTAASGRSWARSPRGWRTSR